MNFRCWLENLEVVINLDWEVIPSSRNSYQAYLSEDEATAICQAFSVSVPGVKDAIRTIKLADEEVKKRIGFNDWELHLGRFKSNKLFLSARSLQTTQKPPTRIELKFHLPDDELRPDGSYPEDYY